MLSERGVFEEFFEPSYNSVCGDILQRLDKFSEGEAVAILDFVRASIGLRRACNERQRQLVKQDGCQQVLRKDDNTAAG